MKNYIMTFILLTMAVAIYLQTSLVELSETIAVTVLKNKDEIKSVHQERNISKSKEYYLDQISFQANGNHLYHHAHGNIGYKEHYFIDFNSSFTTKDSAVYQFSISSDDGFALYIDNKLICQHANDRPLTKSMCSVELKAGAHDFKLNYFQGYGNVGLVALYKDIKEHQFQPVGLDSNNLSFNRQNH
ncbi:PA14 domain-containing protein [Colwellia sp. 20A7]|uniref:PA14 domain-containing protein n=1 Tax=Colwellia sp. 20A7 TaxID=2689569 RepID=UPI00135BF8F4|nr:PA14 domain-containing protein [Colwellia sp. 20A7]